MSRDRFARTRPSVLSTALAETQGGTLTLMRIAAGLVFGAMLLGGCGDDDPNLASFCSYRAASSEELRDCLRHIDSGESVLDGENAAARHARGELKTCGKDAGPFCGDDQALKAACRAVANEASQTPACKQ